MTTKSNSKEYDNALFNVIEYEGFEIKPMSFKELALVSPDIIPVVDHIKSIAEAKDITIDLATIIKVILQILPYCSPVASKLLHITQEEFEEFDAPKAVSLIVHLYQANSSIITDFFSVAGQVMNKG